jgi:hypothetical protein
MPPKLVQVNYTFAGSRAAFEEAFGPIAPEIARVPGLRWKIWMMDEPTGAGGGCYLFDDASAARAYIDGPIIGALRSHPAFTDLSVRVFDVLTGPTHATRGPV